MKILRFGLISFFSLFFIITAISLMIPAHVRISRAMNMHATAADVLNQVGDLGNWNKWYPGFDTLMLEHVKTGNGKLIIGRVASSSTTITLLDTKADEITAQFDAGKQRPVLSGWKAISYSNTDSLTVQWYLDFHLHWYPWEKFLSLTYDKVYGLQMEKGLQNLRRNVER